MKHCTCPVCRYELETDDAGYEQERRDRMKSRKMRYRLDELKAKKISQLRDVAATLQVNIRSCIDKSEVIERLIASGKIELTEGVPTVMKTLEEFEAMGVGELRRLLLSFGLSDEGAIEKRELRNRLLESGRIIIEGGDDMKAGGGSCSGGYSIGGYSSGGYGTPAGYSNGHDPYSGGSYSSGGYSSGGYSTAGYTNGHDPGSSSGAGSSGSSSDRFGDGSASGYGGANVLDDGEVTSGGDSATTVNGKISGGGSKRSYDDDDHDHDREINDNGGNVGGGIYDSASSPYSFAASSSPNPPAVSLRELVSQVISSHDHDGSAPMVVCDDGDNNEAIYGESISSTSTATDPPSRNNHQINPSLIHHNNPASDSTPPRQPPTIPCQPTPCPMSSDSRMDNRMVTSTDTPIHPSPSPSPSVKSSSSASPSPSPSSTAFFGSNVPSSSSSSSSKSSFARTPS